MKEIEALFQELFPERMNSKTLRLKRALQEHLLKSIKELSKQGISRDKALEKTLEKLGGIDKVKKQIKKSNRKWPLLTSPYAVITISLLLGYPLALWIIFGIFDISNFSLILLLPMLIGVGMFMSKVYVAVFEIQSNRFGTSLELNNASVLAGAGLKYKEPGIKDDQR
ncbi:hypothetical protein KB559_08305 [Paenibacillus sp. Marseille-P2973]|uniref:hypothetical protein n=1 Tax=Paenibacillus sp. Marseille-P2973 TaxID=1871032 RepID=UPI001B38E5F4|nr:hypothetical protein [Paenibacillus sp. Marseille-P2973]MBQ4898836.1 hypothetical protein [Paenibacillus sp. Marseille-P2973]